MILVDGGQATPFDGDLDDYAGWFTTREAASEAEQTASPASADTRKQRKREEAERRNRLSPLRNEIANIEKQMTRLQQELARIETALTSPTLDEATAKAQLQELPG